MKNGLDGKVNSDIPFIEYQNLRLVKIFHDKFKLKNIEFNIDGIFLNLENIIIIYNHKVIKYFEYGIDKVLNNRNIPKDPGDLIKSYISHAELPSKNFYRPFLVIDEFDYPEVLKSISLSLTLLVKNGYNREQVMIKKDNSELFPMVELTNEGLTIKTPFALYRSFKDNLSEFLDRPSSEIDETNNNIRYISRITIPPLAIAEFINHTLGLKNFRDPKTNCKKDFVEYLLETDGKDPNDNVKKEI